jgi:6-phosphogluconolactonase
MRESTDVAWVYFGTQRSGPGTGFSRARFDPVGGVLTPPLLVAVAADPSYFVIHPDGRHLYTCNSGTPGGVSAYALTSDTGDLTFLNAHVSRGRGPSHLSLDRSGRFVLAANYGGGYVEVVAIAGDGSLSQQTACMQHEGQSVHPERQTRPYAHCVRVDPDNRFALVADLGLDRIVVYRFDQASGALAHHNPPYVSVPPGSGPRHLAWHPNGRWLYLVEEITSAATVLVWEAGTGTLREIQTLPALPSDFSGESTAAEILVHPGGHFVYVSNRGHDSVAVFAVDQQTGRLTLVQHVPSGGRTPRYMAFDLTGDWLIVANHDSDTATVLALDGTTGRLKAHGPPVSVHRPFGIALVRVEGGPGLS